MAVTVLTQWQGTYATPSGYGSFPPAALSLQIPVANTGNTGNWLIAFCGWRTPAAVQTTVAVGDDSHDTSPGANVWEPLGAPAGTSPLTGSVTTSIWYCRNPWPASNVYISPNGLVTAIAVSVVEVSGMSPWATITGAATGYTGSATTGPSLNVPGSSSQALLLAALASDNDTYTITGPGAGWTSLTPVTASDGTDHNADCVLTPAWQAATGFASASWSSSGSQDMAGVLGSVLVTGNTPVAPSQNWPYVQFLAGYGAEPLTPWAQIGWTDLTTRFQAANSQRGKQYELDSIQAGTINLTLSNNDGALTQGNSASPFAPAVTVNTPARWLATWPPPPAWNSRTYSVWRGFIERWPQALTQARYQITNTTGTDVYALLTTLMKTLPRAEVLADGPYAYWPCADPAGAASAANYAKGNSQQLQVVQSKYGPGGATASFGVTLSFLQGDPGATGWQQASVPAGGTQGWVLYYQDTGLPAISGGVTVEGWFALNTAQPSGLTLILIAVRNSAGEIIQVQVSSAGLLQVAVRDKLTGTVTTTTVGAAGMLTGIPVHLAISFSQTLWTLYVDGRALRSANAACNFANSGYWVTFGGIADRGIATGFCNVIIGHAAVYPYRVPQARVASHWYTAVTGMYGQDTAGPRADRILGDGNCAFPRVMPPGTDLFTGAVDVGGQAVSQNVVNVAESESAWLMADSAGYLYMQGRDAAYNLPAQWTFGEIQAVPLNANYQFNGTITPWTAGHSASLTYSTTWSYGGEGSMLIAGNPSVASPYAISEFIAVTPGQTYTQAVWVYSAQGWSSVHIEIDWYTSSHVLTASAVLPGTVLNAATPTELTVTGRAPALAAYAAIAVYMDGIIPLFTSMYAGYAALLTPGEYAYLQDFATDCDPSQAYNDITLSQLAAPAVYTTGLEAGISAGALSVTVFSATGITVNGVLILDPGTSSGEQVTVTAINGNVIAVTATAFSHAADAVVTVFSQSASGVTITAAWPASIAAYGDQTLQQTSYLADPDAVTDQAWWIAYATGVPVNRIANMTLDPAANPALWPVILGLETGQAVQVNRRLQGTLLVISGMYQVMSVAHSTAPGQWKTKVALVPYPGQVVALDDPQFGIPGTLNALGW